MALHDFLCLVCGHLLIDVDVPVAIGATRGAPLHCDRPAAWIPQVGRMDAYEPFQAFTAYDAQNNPVVIDSLHKLRQVEADSLRRARDGEGQPLVWRRYSQDASNKDVHALHPTFHQERPDPAAVKKFAAAIKRGDADPDTAYGPGVSDATPSALDTLDWKG
ncbi:MAG TPA: hypothetical protein VIX41_05195 [Acidimicrobiales bacterium]